MHFAARDAHNTKGGTPTLAFQEAPVGRLVWILEYRLTPETRAMLPSFFDQLPLLSEPTFVAGLGPPCTLAAAKVAGRKVFNRGEHLPPGEMGRFLPWREIWLVDRGRVWQALGMKEA